MSYPKAIARMWTACNVSVYVECDVKLSDGCVRSDCVHEEFDATKLDGYRAAREQGWTFDAEGNWICSECADVEGPR